jgi:hypothetical protein
MSRPAHFDGLYCHARAFGEFGIGWRALEFEFQKHVESAEFVPFDHGMFGNPDDAQLV